MKRSRRHSDGKRRPLVNEGGNVSLGRHEYYCTICAHPKREEIEQDWIGWGNTPGSRGVITSAVILSIATPTPWTSSANASET